MPLIPGHSRAVQGENVAELRRAGHGEPQAIAIALQHAEKVGHHRTMATLHHAHAMQAAFHPTPSPIQHSEAIPGDPSNGADQTSADSVMGDDVIPAAGGQPPISFQAGGLHTSTGTKPGQKISGAKHAAAKAGTLGPKAKQQETFYENVLKK